MSKLDDYKIVKPKGEDPMNFYNLVHSILEGKEPPKEKDDREDAKKILDKVRKDIGADSKKGDKKDDDKGDPSDPVEDESDEDKDGTPDGVEDKKDDKSPPKKDKKPSDDSKSDGKDNPPGDDEDHPDVPKSDKKKDSKKDPKDSPIKDDDNEDGAAEKDSESPESDDKDDDTNDNDGASDDAKDKGLPGKEEPDEDGEGKTEKDENGEELVTGSSKTKIDLKPKLKDEVEPNVAEDLQRIYDELMEVHVRHADKILENEDVHPAEYFRFQKREHKLLGLERQIQELTAKGKVVGIHKYYRDRYEKLKKGASSAQERIEARVQRDRAEKLKYKVNEAKEPEKKEKPKDDEDKEALKKRRLKFLYGEERLDESREFETSSHHSKMYRYHDQQARIAEKKGDKKAYARHVERCKHHERAMDTQKKPSNRDDEAD